MNDGVDLRRLQVLRMVHHHGTVTAAARALHLTPSAVSHQLRQLARQVGAPLTESHGRGLRLTSAGQALVRHADVLYAQWEQARADVLAHRDLEAGPLRLSGFPTAVAGLLVRAAMRLRRTHPHLRVEVTEVETSEAFDLLLAGASDIAVVVAAPDGPALDDIRFEQQALYREPLDLLVPVGHRLATSVVPLAAASHEPWVLAAAEGCDFHPLVRSACAMAGFTPSAAHDVHSLTAISALVGAGLGVALYPRLAHLADPAAVVRVPLEGDPPPSRQLSTAIRRGSDAGPVAVGLEAIHAEVPKAAL